MHGGRAVGLSIEREGGGERKREREGERGRES